MHTMQYFSAQGRVSGIYKYRLKKLDKAAVNAFEMKDSMFTYD